MTPQELKSSILQLAIQGKLVEQRSEEGTGEELFQQIQAEKQKLIKAEKIKKEKPLPEITEDEIPFDIPESWKWVRFNNLCSVLTCGYASTPTYVSEDDGMPFISAKNVKPYRFMPDDHNYISYELYDKLTQNAKPEKGDILLTRVGAGIGEAAIIDTDLDFAIYVSLTLIKLVNNSLIDNRYVLYWLNSPIGVSSAKKNIYGKNASQGNLNVKNVRDFLVPLPPLAEQKRIVAKIEELLPYIDRYEKAWSRLEEFNKRFPVDMQKSILQMAIQGKLVPQLPEEGTGEDVFQRIKPYHKELKPCKDELDFSSMDFDIPESWTMVELNQLFDFVDYRGKTPTKISEGVFLITASNIRRAYMDYTRKEYISREEYEGRQSRGITQKGDLLFTTEAPMGNAALCDLDECSCGQRIITFKEYTEETVLPALFMYFILSPQFQQQLLDNCTGTTAKGIKADKLKHFLLPLPPYEEQKRIVAKLEEILPLCERLK